MSNQIPSQIRDPIVSASVSQEKEQTKNEGFIADTAVPVTDTATREITDKPVTTERKPSTCACGHGWTFDFAVKRVYCRACEEKR